MFLAGMELFDHLLFPNNYSRTLTLALWRLRKRDHCVPDPCHSSWSIQGQMTTVSKSALSVPDFGSRECDKRRVHEMRPLGRWNWVLVAFIILSVATSVVDSCGPGRGAGRRRAPRKLTPIVVKQHVPNVPENALSASGLSEGKILRGDTQRFKALVANYNPDILFRDDEGTGADRLMTQVLLTLTENEEVTSQVLLCSKFKFTESDGSKINIRRADSLYPWQGKITLVMVTHDEKLRDKLNTLGISVMNQWPGVKLRVTEGWDEDNIHAENNSLHYEGRAVDITTSDKDISKNGMLARLAVEAGFDWVFYKSKSHIHCSVKSDSFQSGRAGGCFSSNSTVQTINGKKKLLNLKVGDKVLTIDNQGNVVYSPVILFLDRNRTEVREFYEIETSNHQTIRLTPSHLLYIIPAASQSDISNFINEESRNRDLVEQAIITFARNIAIGDWILSLESSTTIERSRVQSVRVIESKGVYAPLTTTGTILVDGVLSSCYAVIDSQSLAHWSFLPFRILHNFMEGLKSIWQGVNFLVTLGTNVTLPAQTRSVVNSPSQDNSLKPEVKGLIEDDGVFWYASLLYTLTNRLLPSSLFYQYS